MASCTEHGEWERKYFACPKCFKDGDVSKPINRSRDDKSHERPEWIALKGDHDGAHFEIMTGGAIKIEVGGSVHVRTAREWHALAVASFTKSSTAAAPRRSDVLAKIEKALQWRDQNWEQDSAQVVYDALDSARTALALSPSATASAKEREQYIEDLEATVRHCADLLRKVHYNVVADYGTSGDGIVAAEKTLRDVKYFVEHGMPTSPSQSDIQGSHD